MALITTYHWDFGDGSTSSEQNPVHTYTHPGVYPVTLTIYEDGTPTVLTTSITVIAPLNKTLSQFTLRVALEPAQGVEWSELDGNDWVQPEDVLYITDDNDTPRMLIEDINDNKIWEDATFDRIQFQQSPKVDKYYEENLRTDELRWLLSGSGTNEYYLDKVDGGDPGYEEPKEMYIGTLPSPEGTLGGLQAGFWGYGDNDTLGYDTIYVRLPDDTDPDSKALGYVEGVFWTEIPSETWYGEDVSNPNAEENYQEVVEQHWYTRPYEAENKGKSNYDSKGYRTAQVFSLDMYKDGNLVRPFASVSEIPENGDIVFSGIKLQGRRFQPVFKTTTSEFMIVGRNLFKVIKPMAGSSDEQVTDRTKAEIALASPSFFIGRDRLNPLLNRVNGETIPGSVGLAIGPDGFDGSAIVIPVAGLNLTNDAIAGVYTFLFWRSTTAPVVTVPLLPALTQFGETYSNWQLMYVTASVCPANLVLSQGIASTIRLYSSDVTEYLQLYYNSMRYDEEPKEFEPGM